jgi:hypothetical protein
LATQYIEFDGNGWAKSNADPTRVFANSWGLDTLFQDLGQLLGTDVSNFGMQLVPPNKDPNDPDWFHISLEPLIASSHRRYRIRWIWRQSDTQGFLDNVGTFEVLLKNLLLKLERH